MTRDPVCKIAVDDQDAMQAGLTSEYSGDVYHFCSRTCKKRFDREPAAYVGRFDDWEEWDIPDQLFQS